MHEPDGTSRREFLADVGRAAAAASIIAGTASAGPLMQPTQAEPSQPTAPESVGIARLQLRCADVEALRPFYAQVLGLPVQDHTRGSIRVKAGATELIFWPSELPPASTPTNPTDKPSPYYHFAFNIPENKLTASKAWLAPRCPILKRPDGGDEYHFVSWNAHSIYFLDPAGNILEFIARHNLANASPGAFAPADILYASEIALVVDDVRSAADTAKTGLGLDVFANSISDQFAAVGDDHRLLIIVKRGRIWNSGQGRVAEVHPVAAQLRGGPAGKMESADLRYDVVAGA